MLDQGRIQGGARGKAAPPRFVWAVAPAPHNFKKEIKEEEKWGREGKKMKEKEKRRKYQ